jgi:hypothetical protein
MMTMKNNLPLFAALALVAVACHPIFFWSLEVDWNIDGSKSTTLCATYNIHEFEVVADGPERRTRTFPCNDRWHTGTRFLDLEEGNYKITINALPQGPGKALATRSDSIMVRDDEVSVQPDQLTIGFRNSDFTGGTGQARIKFYWNINSTLDGSAKGTSWDTCADVGASKAVMTVQKVDSSDKPVGPSQKFQSDCHAGGNMSAAVNVEPGDFRVTLKLIDAKNQDLTTTTDMSVPASKLSGVSAKNEGEFIADFYWYSFKQGKDASLTGTYWMNLTFGASKASCSTASPAVDGIGMSMSRLDSFTAGTYKAVTADICPETGACFKTNSSNGPCQASDKKYDIKGIKWGLYKATLNGHAKGLEVCWKQETFQDTDIAKYKTHILVGAVTVNPVRVINVPKDATNTSKTCNP